MPTLYPRGAGAEHRVPFLKDHGLGQLYQTMPIEGLAWGQGGLVRGLGSQGMPERVVATVPQGRSVPSRAEGVPEPCTPPAGT